MIWRGWYAEAITEGINLSSRALPFQLRMTTAIAGGILFNFAIRYVILHNKLYCKNIQSTPDIADLNHGEIVFIDSLICLHLSRNSLGKSKYRPFTRALWKGRYHHLYL